MIAGVDSSLLRGRRPPLAAGLLVMTLLLMVCTLLVYPLGHLTRVSSLGVVYLLGVVVISTFWGLRLGIAMSILSAAAFNFFHLPPAGRFTISDSRNWVALGAFLVAAVVISWVSALARYRAAETERRRAEADLTAEMAQLLLTQSGLGEALAVIGRRLASVFELPAVSVALGEVAGDERREAIPLRSGTERIGTLLVAADLPARSRERLFQGAVPALTAVLAAALERERLVAEAVQTEGLRRSEAIKTAVLRAVSHDLRSPLTAMITAGAAVRAPGVTDAERDELGGLVQQEGTRLSKLIDDLLDLSRLEADAAAPQLAECSVEEVIDAALALQPASARFELAVDRELPAVRADFVQLERAVANVLENATRYGGGAPVRISARLRHEHVVVRVADRGPGIAAADQERIFEPFYRSESGPGGGRGGSAARAGAPAAGERAGARADGRHAGSGLGLAIARGFVETNGGRIWVESALGQGSVFVIELPVAA